MVVSAGNTRNWTLFLIVWAIAALLTRTSSVSWHEWSRMGTIDSIVERGSFELETSRFHGTGDKIFANGHYYSHQPPLLSTLEAPIYWLLRRFGLQFWNSAPFDLAFYLFTVLTNGLAFALTVVLFRRLLDLVGIDSTWRTTTALLLPFGTWLLPYALVSNTHGISALLVMCTAYLLLSISLRGATVTLAGWLGICLGLLAAIEVVPLISFVPLACIFVASRSDMRERRALAAFAAGLVAPLLAHAALNVPLTGDLLPGGFHAELFDYPGSSFTSETLSGQLNHDSIGAFADYAWRALIAEKGYFTFAPVLLAGFVIGLVGQSWWGRGRPAYLVLLWGSVLSLAASLLMTNNFGGVAVGFRHAVYLCPAWLTLLVPALSQSRDSRQVAPPLLNFVAGVSAVVLLLWAVPQPWSQLQWQPEQPPASWRSYVPVIAYIVDRTNGVVDEFGNPSTQSSAEPTTSLRAGPSTQSSAEPTTLLGAGPR
jgi:hypothetical protein